MLFLISNLISIKDIILVYKINWNLGLYLLIEKLY